MAFILSWPHNPLSLAFTLLLFIAHLLVAARAITRPNRTPASRVAWVAVITFLPLLGIVAYLLLGETSIGRGRVKRLRAAESRMSAPAAGSVVPRNEPRDAALSDLARSINGFPATGGNRIALLGSPGATPDAPMLDSNAAIDALIADIDEFKRINDHYSHAAGDLALLAVAHALRDGIGSRGSIARWGGEEFAALFEGMPLEEARLLCEHLRERVQAIDCSAFAPGWSMTMSGGVTERTGLSHHEKLVSRADALLYEAKRAGRNRICG